MWSQRLLESDHVTRYRLGISAPATKLSLASLHIWYTLMRKSGQVLTRQYASVGVKRYSLISQSMRWKVAVSTATSSGRLAWTATIELGFSMRIHGIFLLLMRSSLRRTVALVSAAVPVNSVSPWLACTSPR